MKLRFQLGLFLIIGFLLASCSRSPSDFSPSVDDSHSSAVIGGNSVDDPRVFGPTVAIDLSDAVCTGAYIGDNKVVTAGHCLFRQKARQVSFKNSYGNFSCRVMSQIPHPEYHGKEIEYDIGVIKIKCLQSIKATPFILATKPHDEERLFAAGYGMQSRDEEVFHFPNLKNIPLIVYDWTRTGSDPLDQQDDVRLKSFENAGQIECFGAEIRHTVFFGDSGGPVYAQNEDGTLTLFGINGDLIANDKKGVSSIRILTAPRIDHYREWILKQ